MRRLGSVELAPFNDRFVRALLPSLAMDRSKINLQAGIITCSLGGDRSSSGR